MQYQRQTQCIAIAAGKGGVGKSSVTVNLALALAAEGAAVGILDADLYGPSIGKMVPAEEALQEIEGKIAPAKGLGLYVVSLAHFPLGQKATIVRAPIANQIISEFLHQIQWPKLDFLLIDFPPGTGDIQLTLMQQAALSGAILVTTPQEVALLDVRKAYDMLKAMQVPMLGVVENMSYFESEKTRYYPFGEGGGRRFCEEHALTLLGEIPVESSLSFCCDQGVSLLEHHPDCKASVVFGEIAAALQCSLLKNKLEGQTGVQSFELIWEDK